MRRRAYLSLVAVVLAGCGSQGTDTATPTATGTDTDTETETDESTETETPEPDPATPTPEQAPAEPLPALEFWLTNALEAFVGSAESFGAVTAATDVDAAATREHLAEADAVRQELEGTDLEGDRQTRFEELSGTYHFLRRTVQVHEQLRTAWDVRAETWDAVLTSAEDPGPPFGRLDEAVDEAEADYNSLIAESEPTDVASFPPLLVSDYENKVGQFDAEMTAFRDLNDAFQAFNSAMSQAERGMLHYGNDSWTPASVAFTDAKNAFESVVNQVRGNWPSHFEAPVDDVDCAAGAMAAGCDRMAQVSRAVADGDESDPEAAKQSARSRFERCDIVFERVTRVQNFFA